MNIFSIKWLRRLLLTSIYILGVLGIVGSGGGGGGGGTQCLSVDCVDFSDLTNIQIEFPDPSPGPITNTVLSGRFIDSAVEGLRFETPTQSGLTDANGTFKYINGEAVSFFIGDIMLGTSTAITRITPMNLVPGDSNNPQVVNILRFVQSLDEDNNPDNGIRITDTVSIWALGQVLDFSLSTAEFENAANALLTLLTSGSVNMLIDASSAQAHFLASLNVSNNVMITGDPFCDDWGGTAEFGCRLVPQGAPPDIGLTVTNDTASIFIEIENMQYIELIDTDGDLEVIAVAVFVSNNGAESASVSMRIHLTDENGLSMGYAIANTFPFTPGFSGLVGFTAHPNFQNVSPIVYHGMLLEVDVAGGPITFGEFRQANIYPIDPSSNVGN
jgi:hypothetical protein